MAAMLGSKASLGGITGMLVAAAIQQINSDVTDKAHIVVGITNARILGENE